MYLRFLQHASGLSLKRGNLDREMFHRALGSQLHTFIQCTNPLFFTSQGRQLPLSAMTPSKCLLSVPLTRTGKSGYTNFSHEYVAPKKSQKYYIGFILFGITFIIFGGPLISERYFPSVDAQEIQVEEENKDINDDEKEEERALKKKKIGFRDRKIIDYENRIRHYSTPDKIFRYFATLKVNFPNGDSEIFMTPEDLVRSITPGLKQPEGLGLDQFKKFDPKLDGLKAIYRLPKKGKLQIEGLTEESIFYKLSENGLISFTDYLFLLTLLSVPQRHLTMSFQMFDFDGNGTVSYDEFVKLSEILQSHTSSGRRHRDTRANVYHVEGSALERYFFGQKLDEPLTIEKFMDFYMRLRNELLYMEFLRYEPVNNRITETDFSRFLIIYGDCKTKAKSAMIKRVRDKYGKDGPGISFEELQNFFELLLRINDVDTALTFYSVAGASIDPFTLKHVAHTVAKCELSDHLVDVVFTLFDENGDGALSNREFVHMMKKRLMRGLEEPKDTGFIKLLSALFQCAKNGDPDLWHSKVPISSKV